MLRSTRRIIAEGELAEITSALVQRQHLVKKCLALLCAGLSNFSIFEDETNAFDSATTIGSGNIELNDAVRAIFNRSGKEFAAGEISFAVAIDEYAVFDRECQVSAIAFDMYPLVTNKPVYQTLLLCGKLFPASNGVGVVEETHIEDKRFKICERHARVLRIAMVG